MGLVNPASRTRAIHSHTSGRSALPDNPPPPNFANGEVFVPHTFFQSIPSQPNGKEFDTHIASQAGWLFSSNIALIGAEAMLNFGIRGAPGISSLMASSILAHSSISTLAFSPLLGQDKFICKPIGAENPFSRTREDLRVSIIPAMTVNSRILSSRLLAMDVIDIKNGLLRFCHFLLSSRALSPGLLNPMELSITPSSGLTLMQAGKISPLEGVM